MNTKITQLKKQISLVSRVMISLIGLKLFIQLLEKLLFKDNQNIYKYKTTLKGRIYREKVNTYETEFIEFVSKDMNSKQKPKIIMVPGNPGLIKFYDSFLDELHRLLNREVEITGISHANHFLSKKNDSIFNLDSQIDHKIMFMLKEIKFNREQKFILIGHSIGCYMILKMMEIEKIRKRVDQVVMLYPTIERMRESPNGQNLRILSLWGIRTFVPLFLRFITLMLDQEDRQKMLVYLANLKSGDLKTRTILLDLIDTNFMKNILFLFRSELNQVKKLDYDYLNELDITISLYYGQSDGWTPSYFIKELNQKIKNRNIRVMVDNNNIDHAFVLESSIKQAKIVNSIINDGDCQSS